MQLYCPAQTRTVALRHSNTNSVEDVNLVSAATVDANEWHHLAATFPRTGCKTGHVRL